MVNPRGSDSDRRELDALFSVAYEELRRVASSVQRRDRSSTASPTTLVNQAWLKLAAAPQFKAVSPLHFKRIAARAMRQVLVDAARRRQSVKRGGGEAVFITVDESLHERGSSQEVLALDAALQELARFAPRQAEAVEYRFFGGLDVAETASLLGVSEATVLRDWRAARAWLAKELRTDG